MSELLKKVVDLLEERRNYGISGDSRLSDWRWRAATELPNVAEELRIALLQIRELKQQAENMVENSLTACRAAYKKGLEDAAKTEKLEGI